MAEVNRILMVFEFPPGDHEWQLRDLAKGLSARRPRLRIDFCTGPAGKYRPGGLHPRRLAGGFWVHLRAFFQIVTGRYDAVLVRSSPPLIPMTVAAACRLRRIPYWVWLMDAHPEIERELWEKIPVLGWLCGLLVRVNAGCLRRADIVVVLDEGMRRRLVPSLAQSRVIVCPTWVKAAR